MRHSINSRIINISYSDHSIHCNLSQDLALKATKRLNSKDYYCV